MPSESAPPSAPSPGPSFPAQPSSVKCSLCGAGAWSSPAGRSNEGIVFLVEPMERICGGCVRAQEVSSASARSQEGQSMGLGLHGIEDEPRGRRMSVDSSSPESDNADLPPPCVRDRSDGFSFPRPMSIPTTLSPPDVLHSQSLPSKHPRPWSTALPASAIPEGREATPSPASTASPKRDAEERERPPNPLLDVTKARVPSVGRGALYPGSIFKGTQTSGRSAYEVEVRLLDVNFPESTLSGYLSISHLTDSHPHLTTFFTGEIIGPKYGFITGSRFGATEHDDMRHWGRFEQFRRPSTRADMIRPDLLFRDPLPDRNRGETKAKERDFVFLRIKERFLVPDHTVRDISGASFAGFYFAMVDLSTSGSLAEPPTPISPSTPKAPLVPTSPTIPRRMSSTATSAGGDVRSPTRERARRRESAGRAEPREGKREATIRGYYFHSLNQEPFQELFLAHVPNRSSSTFELR